VKTPTTIRDGLEGYLESVLPKDSSLVQQHETQQAFICGATMAVKLILQTIGQMPSEQRYIAMKKLIEESNELTTEILTLCKALNIIKRAKERADDVNKVN